MVTDLQVISDPILVRSLQSKVESIVDGPWHLKSSLMRNGNWIAVPVEKGRHFEEAQADAVSDALQAVGCTECFAVATEPTGEYPSCYMVAPTKEGLLAFSWECAGLNFALIDGNPSFAILCTSEDYNIVAGPPDFVETAIGSDIQSARRAFRDFASDEWWEGRLLTVADRYEHLSPRG